MTFATGLLVGPMACGTPAYIVDGPASCAVEDQNAYVLDVLEAYYLWNAHLPADVDPAAYSSPASLVHDVRIGVDRWTRVADAARTVTLQQDGKIVGLGFSTRRDLAGRVRIAHVVPGSPADVAGLRRGDVVVAVGDATAEELDAADAWSGAYGPREPGVRVSMTVERAGGALVEIEIVKDWVSLVTVPYLRALPLGDGRSAAYMAFESFVEPAIAEIDAAVEALAAQDPDVLVLDLRYNGGGLLDVAHHLANRILGRRASGALFYRARHNADRRDLDFQRRFEDAGPSLDPQVVFVLTSRSTASAAELLAHGLAPHVEVVRIGDHTAGKPVGFHQFSFCDKKLQPVTFRFENALGRGGYYDGLTPHCPVLDDFEHERGDPDEALLAEALAIARGEGCSAPSRPPAVPAFVPGPDDGAFDELLATAPTPSDQP